MQNSIYLEKEQPICDFRYPGQWGAFHLSFHGQAEDPGEHLVEEMKAMGIHDAFMGVEIDPELNAKRGKEMIISTPNSKVQVWVVPTNEELMIAQDTADLVKAAK